MDPEFERRAEAELQRLMGAIDAALGDDIDVDYQNGILTLELEDGRQYVINRHGPNREIWLSSPQSGAWHFAYDAPANAWRSTRGAGALTEILNRELADITGTDPRL
jgi:frataxin